MANNLPPIWRFDFGDYSGLGGIFQKFLANLNLFTLNVYNALNGGIGFSNMQRIAYSATVTAGTTTPLKIVNPLSITPSCIYIAKVTVKGSDNTVITNAVSAANWTFDGKNINILNIVGLTSGTAYNITLEIA